MATGVKAITDRDVIEAVSTSLQSAMGCLSSAPKRIACAIGRNPRTVKNWLYEESAPNAAALIELMREFDEVYEAVLELSGRQSSNNGLDPEFKKRAELAYKILTGEIDGTFNRNT